MIFYYSDFNFDEWKSCYRNKDLDVSKKYFEDNFDKDAFSIFICDYNYPQYYKLGFNAENLVGGMLQRVEGLRKHVHSIMLTVPVPPLTGCDKETYTITGAWIIRGLKNPFLVCTRCPRKLVTLLTRY